MVHVSSVFCHDLLKLPFAFLLLEPDSFMKLVLNLSVLLLCDLHFIVHIMLEHVVVSLHRQVLASVILSHLLVVALELY